MIRNGIFALLAVALAPGLAGAESTDPEVRLVEVASGVYAALQEPERRFNDSNSAVIVGERKIAVVDGQTNAAWVRSLIREIRRLGPLPVAYVINTHWHGDHTDGNHLYRAEFPGVELVAHRSVPEDIARRATPDREEQIARYTQWIEKTEAVLAKGETPEGEPLSDEDRAASATRLERARKHVETLRSVVPMPPTITYESSMTLDLGSRQILLLHAKAHTRGDTVVFLAKEGVLITGDLLDELPFGGHGYPRSWLEALDHLGSLDFEILIPGHGPLFHGKEQLQKVHVMVRTVIERVEAGIAEGWSLEQTQERIDLSDLRRELAGEDSVAQRNFDGFLPPLVERTYLESTGALVED